MTGFLITLSLVIPSAGGSAPTVPVADGTAQFGDMAAYWIAGRAFLEGKDPFDPAVVAEIETREGLRQAFVVWNPPWILPLCGFLALFPFQVAAGIWLIVNVASSIATGAVLGRNWGLSSFATTLLTMSFVPIMICLGMSQWGIVVLASVVAFDVLRRHGFPFLAGACLVAATIKPHLVSLIWLVPILLGSRFDRIRMLTGLGASLSAAMAVTWLWQPKIVQRYAEALEHPSASSPANYFSATAPRWLRGMVETISGAPAEWVQWLPLLLAATVAAFWLHRLANRKDENVVPRLLLLSQFVLPYGWHYDQVLLLPVYLLLWGEVWRQSGRYRATGLAGTLVLVNAGMGMMLVLGAKEASYFFWPAVVLLIDAGWSRFVDDGRADPSSMFARRVDTLPMRSI